MIKKKDELTALLKKHWGYDSFHCYQEGVIEAVINGRDSLSVVSTGGGKSLCYQLPSLLSDNAAVVISPLISLMQDQVGGLREMGIRASFINSTQTPSDRELAWQELERGDTDLLYLAPERLESGVCVKRLQEIKPGYFVIDEAHCISQWGHDFREAYLGLDKIKKFFPSAAVHAFTATATPEVREDILRGLRLKDPLIYIGEVDRENLTYRVKPRNNGKKQIMEVLSRHRGECGIIYCLRRKDVDKLSGELRAAGYGALPYHAGLSDKVRSRNQARFQEGGADIIVATVAFGMGIDRPDVRYVIHAAMPKSMEHYQQETGRAGRDGEPAECVLFFSGSDYFTWKHLLKDSSKRDVMLRKLSQVYSFCYEPVCRHRRVAEYFGQVPVRTNCRACDYCLGELEEVSDPLVTAQKIISCVARLRPAFGAGHIVNILAGSKNFQVTNLCHDRMSTYGLLSGESRDFIGYMLDQLISQGFLQKTEDSYPVVKITPRGWEALRGNETPTLVRPVRKKQAKTEKKRTYQSDDTDDELFVILSRKRREIAAEKGLPAYMIVHNRSLKEMSALKPSTIGELEAVHGMGAVKLEKYGEAFLEAVRDYLAGSDQPEPVT